MFSNGFGCHIRVLFGDLICTLQRCPLPRMGVSKPPQCDFVGGLPTGFCCHVKLILNTCADAKQASQVHAFLLGQGVQPTQKRLKSISLEILRVLTEKLACTRAPYESVFAEIRSRSHKRINHHRPQLQLLKLHVAVGQGNCFLSISEIALCSLPRILGFALRIECSLRKLIGLHSKTIRLPPQPKRSDTKKDCRKNRDDGDHNCPSIPPDNAAVDTQIRARANSFPPAHSLISLWFGRNSAMTKQPQVRHV